MRRYRRIGLPPPIASGLAHESTLFCNRLDAGEAVNINYLWKTKRKSKLIQSVLMALQSMAGVRWRCMYCGDSHGTDIEHFWPKKPYPKKMFEWPNLLLCCTDCGRIKGDRFPIQGDRSLMIDPTTDDPWTHLDFDPETGNIVARFDVGISDWDVRGTKTVEVLQLDRREALAATLKRSHKRLTHLAAESIRTGNFVLSQFLQADDTGLLEWCLFGTGAKAEPFSLLVAKFPQLRSEYADMFH